MLWRDHLADCKWPTVRISLTLAGTALLGIAFDKYMPQIPNAKYTLIYILCPKITTVKFAPTLAGKQSKLGLAFDKYIVPNTTANDLRWFETNPDAE